MLELVIRAVDGAGWSVLELPPSPTHSFSTAAPGLASGRHGVALPITRRASFYPRSGLATDVNGHSGGLRPRTHQELRVANGQIRGRGTLRAAREAGVTPSPIRSRGKSSTAV
jgi:hypothetical protein